MEKIKKDTKKDEIKNEDVIDYVYYKTKKGNKIRNKNYHPFLIDDE
jgi:hypothetical protein